MLLLFHSRCALFVNKDVDLWDGVSGQELYQPAAGIELPTTGGAHAGQRRPVEARELQLAQAGGEVVVEMKEWATEDAQSNKRRGKVNNGLRHRLQRESSLIIEYLRETAE